MRQIVLCLVIFFPAASGAHGSLVFLHVYRGTEVYDPMEEPDLLMGTGVMKPIDVTLTNDSRYDVKILKDTLYQTGYRYGMQISIPVSVGAFPIQTWTLFHILFQMQPNWPFSERDNEAVDEGIPYLIGQSGSVPVEFQVMSKSVQTLLMRLF